MSEAASQPAQDSTQAGKEAAASAEAQPQGSLLGGEQKTEAGKQTATSEGKPQDSKSAVPEKYELKLKEGSQLKPEHVDKVALFAKERGLSNDQAQALLEREDALLTDYVRGQQEHLKATAQAWVDQAKADKEIGGPEFAKNVELASRVVNRFGDESFKSALNETGLGNHPSLIRVFTRIAKTMSEDQLVMPGQHSSAPKKDVADVLYPTTAKKQ